MQYSNEVELLPFKKKIKIEEPITELLGFENYPSIGSMPCNMHALGMSPESTVKLFCLPVELYLTNVCLSFGTMYTHLKSMST